VAARWQDDRGAWRTDPANAYRNDIWLFAADGSDATPGGGTNLSDRHDIMPASGMNSDITPGEGARLIPSADGRWLSFLAPRDGAYQLWRIAVQDGALEQLTEGRQFLSSFDQVDGRGARSRAAFIRSSPTELPDVWVRDGAGAHSPAGDVVQRRGARGRRAHRAPGAARDRGRPRRPGLVPAGRAERLEEGRPLPLVTEIHGGPHTLYGWSPVLEFQILAANGIGVYYSNPRGSEGYGREFNEANLRDWGHGPMRDVLAGVDALVADGLADRSGSG
jgi:dipeptidyl aminopeptidase/acylaminoacyl peptidase